MALNRRATGSSTLVVSSDDDCSVHGSKRTISISGAVICASVAFGASTGAPKISATPPHIFFVLVDDLVY